MIVDQCLNENRKQMQATKTFLDSNLNVKSDTENNIDSENKIRKECKD